MIPEKETGNKPGEPLSPRLSRRQVSEGPEKPDFDQEQREQQKEGGREGRGGRAEAGCGAPWGARDAC